MRTPTHAGGCGQCLLILGAPRPPSCGPTREGAPATPAPDALHPAAAARRHWQQINSTMGEFASSALILAAAAAAVAFAAFLWRAVAAISLDSPKYRTLSASDMGDPENGCVLRTSGAAARGGARLRYEPRDSLGEKGGSVRIDVGAWERVPWYVNTRAEGVARTLLMAEVISGYLLSHYASCHYMRRSAALIARPDPITSPGRGLAPWRRPSASCAPSTPTSRRARAPS